MRNAIDRGLDNCVIGLMAFLVLDVLWQVCSRYVFSRPSPWTEELATFLLIWVGLLGAAVAYREHAHLGVDLLPARMAPRGRRAVEMMALTLTALFCVLVLIYGGATLVIRTVSLAQTSPALGLPMGYVYLALPVSGCFMTVYSLQFLAVRFSNVDAHHS